jgi:hypothetical protein
MSIMSRQILLTYVGATGRPIRTVLTDGTTPLDLQSEDITVNLYANLGGTAKIAGEEVTKEVVGENEAGEDGQVAYLPDADEIDVAGDYECQFEIVTSDGEEEPTYTYEYSEKFILRVQATLVPEAVPEE